MGTDGDGRIRTPEVLSAIEYLKSKNVDLDGLFKPSDDDERRLEDVLSRQARMAKAEPDEDDKKAIAEWEKQGESDDVAFLGEDTAEADAALRAVEDVIDGFFTPPDDMPLVTDAPDAILPLVANINPKYQDDFASFREKCVGPVLGRVESLDRAAWKKVKAAFAPYRAWLGSKPVVNAGAKGDLEDEERTLRYKLHLLEFLENYVNLMKAAIDYSDGLVVCTDHLNPEVEEYLVASKKPFLSYQDQVHYAQACNEFYDTLLEKQ